MRFGKLRALTVEQLVDGLLPQPQPSLEVTRAEFGAGVQGGMGRERATAVATGSEQDRLPERRDPRHVRLKVQSRDVREQPPDHRVGERPAVERAHQPLTVAAGLDVVGWPSERPRISAAPPGVVVSLSADSPGSAAPAAADSAGTARARRGCADRARTPSRGCWARAAGGGSCRTGRSQAPAAGAEPGVTRSTSRARRPPGSGAGRHRRRCHATARTRARRRR